MWALFFVRVSAMYSSTSSCKGFLLNTCQSIILSGHHIPTEYAFPLAELYLGEFRCILQDAEIKEIYTNIKMKLNEEH